MKRCHANTTCKMAAEKEEQGKVERSKSWKTVGQSQNLLQSSKKHARFLAFSELRFYDCNGGPKASVPEHFLRRPYLLLLLAASLWHIKSHKMSCSFLPLHRSVSKADYATRPAYRCKRRGPVLQVPVDQPVARSQGVVAIASSRCGSDPGGLPKGAGTDWRWWGGCRAIGPHFKRLSI
jgi:hypothetical protein